LREKRSACVHCAPDWKTRIGEDVTSRILDRVQGATKKNTSETLVRQRYAEIVPSVNRTAVISQCVTSTANIRVGVLHSGRRQILDCELLHGKTTPCKVGLGVTVATVTAAAPRPRAPATPPRNPTLHGVVLPKQFRVPPPSPEAARRAGAVVQLAAFMAMNIERHVKAHRDLYDHLANGDLEKAKVSTPSHRRQ
jgi:PHB de-polymerase C-terminus